MSRTWLGVLAVLLAGQVALAGPFERVPAGNDVYSDLAVLSAHGLSRSSLVQYREGEELTRFQCALLWKAAYDELRRRSTGLTDQVASPDARVVEAVAAMLRLLDEFRTEAEDLEIDTALARQQLARLPRQLPDLQTGARRTLGTRRPAPASATNPFGATAQEANSGLFGQQSLSLTGGDIGLRIDQRTDLTGDQRTDLDARLSAGLFGSSEAGFSLQQMQVTESDTLGPSRLLVGRVLAADLRLRMGDSRVILEYARSLAETHRGGQTEDHQGEAFKAGLLRQISRDLSVDVGYRRIGAGYAPLGSLLAGEALPDMSGVEAGLDWRWSSFGLRSRAAVYLPDGQSVGYINQLGTEMSYRPYDQLQLSVLYQLSTRRRLADLDDAWRRYLNARVVYDLSSRLQAEGSYRYEAGAGSFGLGPDEDHTFGLSLGIGF